ncbi:MAG: M48 family metalloprotease [Phycisphaerae bacterium]|nr:M48 family metalloprotease [Phycisphaerae bacterium]
MLLASTLVHDLLRGESDAPFGFGLSAWGVVRCTLLGHLLLGAVAFTILTLTCRAFARSDGARAWRAVKRSESVLVGLKWAVVIWHVVGVGVLGWIEAVRATIGDHIGVDEIIAVLPPAIVLGAAWWAAYPVQRAIADAFLLRNVEVGRPVYATPTRAGHVIGQFRSEVLVTAVPLLAVLVWTEGCERLIQACARGTFAGHGAVAIVTGWLAEPGRRELTLAGLQVVGIAGVFMLAPVALRRIWDTVPLVGEGLPRRVRDLGEEAGVRFRHLLLWRTGGTMVNGAVMGLWSRVRYILLTDALLDELSEREIEAVVAHEIAHVRFHHIAWLAVAVLASGGGGAILADALAGSIAGWRESLPTWLDAARLACAFGPAVLVFGFVSRRFEWQADAFAVTMLSRPSPGAPAPGPPGSPAPPITEEAVNAMAGALDAVARWGGVPRGRFSFRHGSIAARQSLLRALVALPPTQLEIHAVARRIKRSALLALLAVAASAILGWP